MSAKADRWGIIYKPRAGAKKKQKRWYQIRDYLNLRGVKYDSFQSEGEGSTELLAKMLIDEGYKTIVVVGGDEALNDAINAIMFAPKHLRSEITVGVIPNGIGNDFASFWGLDVDNYKQAVHWIIEGRVKKIDVGYCSYMQNSEQRVRYFLMSVNVGLGAQAIRLSDICKRFGKKNPSYILALLMLFMERKQYKMRIKVNNEEINERVMTLCVGNTRGYGLTPSAVPYSGWLDISIVSRPQFCQLLKGIYMLLHGRFLNHEQVKPYRSKSVVISEAEGAMTCIDGHTLEHTYPLTIGLEPSVVNFIIPG